MNIYVHRDDEQFGPYSEHEIQRQFAQGTLLPTDLVWHEGRRDWTPLKDFLEVQATSLPPAEPESRYVRTFWLGASIVLASLFAVLSIGFLVLTHLKAPDVGDSLETTVKHFDAKGAPNNQTTTTANSFRAPTETYFNQTTNGVFITPKIKIASQPVDESQSNAALDAINAALKSDPKNLYAYLSRAAIYGQRKLWPQAESDYRTVLQLDNKNFVAKFNLAEIKFQQKEYAGARTDFITLKDNSENGDFAKYKVFLCDLFNGNETMAAKELDTFSQIGTNASYYYGNAAWDLYHKKPEEARGWLASAKRIYAPNKCSLYGASLQDLGYLPLAPATQ